MALVVESGVSRLPATFTASPDVRPNAEPSNLFLHLPQMRVGPHEAGI